ncbi:formate dehydrogenase accessory sulfurtransferase FdhD [Undibacterium sp. Ji49W]|uniref:formate dehydrogenase accessory sulfurtransferase FdhD n=1 Tax=Undibacterium sp. Ji49W TaxID=3413040 RepID=UPI003BF2FEB7
MRRDKVNESLSDNALERAIRVRQVQRHVYASPQQQDISDQLAEEMPVAMVFNGISHAVMLATPVDLEDFAIGFSLSEQIIDDLSDIYDIECRETPGTLGVEVHLHIAASCFARLKERRRSLAGNTGCGLCGIESLQALPAQVPPVSYGGRAVPMLHKSSLLKAIQALGMQQPFNILTGAMHAAAWVDLEGDIRLLREDVGRHNALDKLIGAMSDGDHTGNEGFVLMSSRISYELVQKMAHANIAILAAISAPTALAIDIAERSGICLIGFVREHGFVVYSHPEMLVAE